MSTEQHKWVFKIIPSEQVDQRSNATLDEVEVKTGGSLG